MPKPSLVGGEATTFSQPAEDSTLQRCSTPPNFSSQIIHLQTERYGIEILVRKLFVSEAAHIFLRNVVAKIDSVKFRSEKEGQPRQCGRGEDQGLT
jgi:hypothetical protein